MLDFMVRPFIEEFTNIIVVEIIAKCPYCGHSMVFFFCAPKQCSNCDCILPNFGSVLSIEKGRLEYHKYGTATGNSGALENFIGEIKNEFHRSKTWKSD